MELKTEMEATFAAKSATYEQNQKVRKEELEALAKAIEIIANPDVAGSYKEHINLSQLPGGKVTLLQMRSSKRRVATRQAAADFLQRRARTLESKTLMSLAAQVAASPFAKVIGMIEDLIAKLKEEANAEAQHKQWCDEQLKANKLKRNKKTTKVDELTAAIEELDGKIKETGDTITRLIAEQAELAKAMKEATAQREKEKAKNLDTIADAKAGRAAVKAALAVLRAFYSKQAAFLQAHQVPVYFNILCCVDPTQIPRLSPCDDEIYNAFRKEFPDMKVNVLNEIEDLKSDAMKKQWREFCEAHKHVEDYSFATLLRVDSSGEYEEDNSVIVTKIQFYAIELARNREGHNSSIRHKFKPKPRKARKATTASNQAAIDMQTASDASSVINKKEIENELKQILTGQHPMLQ